MLGPGGILAHAASEDIASRADSLIILDIMASLTYYLLSRLGSDLQPAIGAVFDVGIVAFRITAIMPIIRCLSLRLRLNLYDLWLLLDVNRWCRRHCDGGRIAIIWCIPVIRRISIRRGSTPIIAQAITQ